MVPYAVRSHNVLHTETGPGSALHDSAMVGWAGPWFTAQLRLMSKRSALWDGDREGEGEEEREDGPVNGVSTGMESHADATSTDAHESPTWLDWALAARIRRDPESARARLTSEQVRSALHPATSYVAMAGRHVLRAAVGLHVDYVPALGGASETGTDDENLSLEVGRPLRARGTV